MLNVFQFLGLNGVFFANNQNCEKLWNKVTKFQSQDYTIFVFISKLGCIICFQNVYARLFINGCLLNEYISPTLQCQKAGGGA